MVADDLTGAVDLAAGLAAEGLRTEIRTALGQTSTADVDAVVVALKSRSIGPQDAVAMSLQAAQGLLQGGVSTLYFKYCSTFDSTPEGNIGPVSDALMDLTAAPIVVVAPGYPAQRRTVYRGHLFVGSRLLSDSAMRHHPLNPMTESNLVTLMSDQSQHEVGRVGLVQVRNGELGDQLERLSRERVRYAVVDTITDGDLDEIADACSEHLVVTGGAALAQAMARRSGVAHRAGSWTPPHGRRGVVSGSCSVATGRQVRAFASVGAVLEVDPLSEDHEGAVDAASAWALARPEDEPFLVTTATDPGRVAAAQAAYGGAAGASHVVEEILGRIATRLVEGGVRRLVVAGGETSGAVVAALGVTQLRVVLPIAPGLAWCETADGLALALKSGNFGADSFFSDALRMLDEVAS